MGSRCAASTFTITKLTNEIVPNIKPEGIS